MMVNFLLIVVIIALAAWLGNVLIAMERLTAQSRTRVRGVRDTVTRLEITLSRLQNEEETLLKDIDKTGVEIGELRQRHTDIQQKLTEAQSRRRPQLLILSDRRNPGDKEWLVTVANPQIREVEAGHPLAQEWLLGRDYLVWAGGEKEAASRAMRRFSARPGYVVKKVAPLREDLFQAPRPAGTG